ncbi:hypothetical protein EV368DRAFT_66767 [Lentinula lateritia]|nr:hypothetical protein EV368DRAFT_66767 [Lentinula lateritia]
MVIVPTLGRVLRHGMVVLVGDVLVWAKEQIILNCVYLNFHADMRTTVTTAVVVGAVGMMTEAAAIEIIVTTRTGIATVIVTATTKDTTATTIDATITVLEAGRFMLSVPRVINHKSIPV